MPSSSCKCCEKVDFLALHFVPIQPWSLEEDRHLPLSLLLPRCPQFVATQRTSCRVSLHIPEQGWGWGRSQCGCSSPSSWEGAEPRRWKGGFTTRPPILTLPCIRGPSCRSWRITQGSDHLLLPWAPSNHTPHPHPVPPTTPLANLERIQEEVWDHCEFNNWIAS